MCRSLSIGVVVVALAWQLGGCGGGVLPGGTAGAPGSAGAPDPAGTGGTVLTGMGGTIITTGRGGEPNNPCAQQLPALRVPPNVVILLDRSRAMDLAACADCGLRWAAAVDAINTTVSDTQADVSWGLELVGDDTPACGTAGDVDVGPTLGAAAPIAAMLSTRTTVGATNPINRPIRDAVVAVTRHVAALSQRVLQPSYVVVMTAGMPTCATGASGGANVDDTAATVEAVRQAFSAGVGTFVIALGTDVATATSLQNIASAGNPNLTGPVPNLFMAYGRIDAESALRTVGHATQGCVFEVPPPPNDHVSQGSIGVRLGGVEIPQDATTGWTYLDANLTAIQLHGAACDAARANGAEPPMINYRCLLP
jgi:hypothetical protein